MGLDPGASPTRLAQSGALGCRRADGPRPPEMRDHGTVKDLEDLAPGEAQRAKRRDRKRVTRMVVDGGNLLRQVEALRARSERRRQGSADSS